MVHWAVRTLFEGSAARYVPWRARTRLERAAFVACRYREGPDVVPVAPGSAVATIAAVGDLAVHGFGEGREAGRARAAAAVRDLLHGADLRVGNLETVLTDRRERAGRLGSFLRAVPESLRIVGEGGMDVVTCANNHCLDFGAAALRESAALVRGAGVDVCGVGETVEEARRPVLRTVNGVRVGILAYCDDWRPAAADGFLPAPADDADILADVAALRPRVDVLVLQLHWGWEWAVHPLVTLRDRARRYAEAGADVVLCHHAHVPMAVEPWGRSIVAHGLGNFFFPWTGKADHVAEHRWRDRSFVLEVGVSAAGVHEARLVPVHYEDGRVARSEGGDRREMLGGLDALRQGLDDTHRLEAIERDRMAREGRGLALRLRGMATRGDAERLGELLHSLRTPRSRMLVAGLRSLPDGSGAPLADLLGTIVDEGAPAVERAVKAGRLRQAEDRLSASVHLCKEPPGRTP